jgi:holliday junction DNA helicase RuvA
LIAHLSGTLLSKQPNLVIVDVGGVGYEVTIPLSTFYDLSEENTPVALRIHTHVREDVLQLFGFRTEREKKLFLYLLSVSGIGPKLAITILSGMSADELIPAIRNNELARLVNIPGVGKKTAERLIVELKDKLSVLSSPELEEQFRLAAGTGSTSAMVDDIISALVNLGFQRAAAEKAVKATMQETPDANFSQLTKLSMRKLAR